MPNPNAQVSPKPYRTLRISDFSKGENRKQGDYSVGAIQPLSLKNWYLTSDGSLFGRRGTVRWNAASIGSGRTRGSVRAYPTNGNTPHFLAYHGTAVHLGTDSTKTFAVTTRTGLSATALMTFTQWLKYVYAPNGVNAHQKWNADTQVWEPWGIAAPSTGPTAAVGSSGVLSGTYRFKVTFLLASGAESNGSPAGNDVVVAAVPVTATDEFTRADNLSLGANWTEIETSTDSFKIVSNVLRMGATGNAGFATYTGSTFGNNHDSQLKLVGLAANLGLKKTGVGVRFSGVASNAVTGYAAFWRGDTNVIELRKFVSEDLATGGTGTLLGSASVTMVVNNTLRIQANGSSIRVFYNGTQVISATDTAITTGKPAVVLAAISGAGGTNWDWDSWVGGDLAGAEINLTSILVGGSGVTQRRVYGFKAGVSSVYQLITTIANNSDTTYTVTADQDDWTTELPIDQDPPPATTWIGALHKNRFWLAGDSANPTRLYFSKPRASVAGAEAEAWPATSFLDIALDTGDEITALFPLGDVLLVFGNESVFYITGDDDFSFFPNRSNATSGAPGPWAVDKVVIPGVSDSVAFLSRHGVMIMAGTEAVLASEAEEPMFSDLPDQLNTLNYAEADEATVKFYDKLKALLISFPTGSSTVNDFSMWFFIGHGFVEDSREFKQVLTLGTHDTDGKIYGWDKNDGILRELDTTFTDDGVEVTASIELPYVKGDPRSEVKESTKRWKWLSFVTGSKVNVLVTAQVDEGAEVDRFQMDSNEDEMFSSAMIGRQLKLTLSFGLSSFFRLTEVVVRYWVRSQFRSGGRGTKIASGTVT